MHAVPCGHVGAGNVGVVHTVHKHAMRGVLQQHRQLHGLCGGLCTPGCELHGLSGWDICPGRGAELLYVCRGHMDQGRIIGMCVVPDAQSLHRLCALHRPVQRVPGEFFSDQQLHQLRGRLLSRQQHLLLLHQSDRPLHKLYDRQWMPAMRRGYLSERQQLFVLWLFWRVLCDLHRIRLLVPGRRIFIDLLGPIDRRHRRHCHRLLYGWTAALDGVSLHPFL